MWHIWTVVQHAGPNHLATVPPAVSGEDEMSALRARAMFHKYDTGQSGSLSRPQLL